MALRLLGGQVGGGAEHGGRLGDVAVGVDRPCDAEVGHLHAALVGHEDVAGLDVPVDEAAVVGVLQRGGDVGGDLEGPLLGQAARPDGVLQPPALHQLHDDERQARPAVHAGVEHRDDVRMVEVGRAAALLGEALLEGLVVPEPRQQHLDGDLAVEVGVPGLVDLRHAAAPQ